jgi:ABC-type antimicrobial peptide transport system permease subunit
MFCIIGALVLLIACINFINLATARSEKRAKEVAVRKTMGSKRKSLVFQFLAESCVFVSISMLLALVFVILALPAFNTLTENRISFPFTNYLFWLIIIPFIFFITVIAGSWPAFYFSAFSPVKVLHNKGRVGKTGTLPRKILVVIQFSCSVALIISTAIIYKQIQYAKDRPVGYDVNRLMTTDLNSGLVHQYAALKNELLQSGVVETVSAASSPAADLYWHSNIDNWHGRFSGETAEMGTVQVAEDYFKTLKIPFVAGRDFLTDADTLAVIFNEKALKRLRLNDPLNQKIVWQGQSFRIIGVVGDALMLSPFAPTEPMMFLFHPSYENFLLYRLSSYVKTEEAITKLTGIFNRYNPAFPYMYQFADEHYAAKFKLEVLIGKLAALFAGLAIFISCVGLFGLTAFIAEQRAKEISIRKALGASLSQLWFMLTKEFLVLVIISCAVATPITAYILHGWLQQYDYRISMGATVFIYSALMALIVTMLTISYQAIKAAAASPVENLRTE